MPPPKQGSSTGFSGFHLLNMVVVGKHFTCLLIVV